MLDPRLSGVVGPGDRQHVEAGRALEQLVALQKCQRQAGQAFLFLRTDRFGRAVRFEIEPGRYIVAESGFLIAEIRAVKRQGNNTFYLLDAGFNNLARPILYGAYHPMSLAPADGREDRPRREVIVGGPLCESGDIFTQEEGGFVVARRLPEADVGDLLAIECAGAYGAVMSSIYNTRLLVPEVLVKGESWCVVRPCGSFDELIGLDRVPEWLV